MKDRYKTIHSIGVDEIIINKSRFIGYAKPIDSQQDAIDFIEEIKSKHRDATHNVLAYVFGENSNIQRYSDDGEPSGTAGIPVLEVIKKEDLRNVVIVVTRYFGGKKLGAGGLVRAYTKGAKIALDAANIVHKVLYNRIKIRVDYTLYGKVENDLLAMGYIIEDVIYDDAVNLIVLCETSGTDELKNKIIDMTSAKVKFDMLGKEFFSIDNGQIIK
ncbi:YigZ family protein [Clostridiisalibacter paucivorans]|uniref:YigZ family protein n=1 Tax=Clostridiisalibacter paucivorans TaxID=408753 RepID=UPI00047CF2BE|nr:YigZ family protein [Clostridiisalibacter paucivorans]